MATPTNTKGFGTVFKNDADVEPSDFNVPQSKIPSSSGNVNAFRVKSYQIINGPFYDVETLDYGRNGTTDNLQLKRSGEVIFAAGELSGVSDEVEDFGPIGGGYVEQIKPIPETLTIALSALTSHASVTAGVVDVTKLMEYLLAACLDETTPINDISDEIVPVTLTLTPQESSEGS